MKTKINMKDQGKEELVVWENKQNWQTLS
jgi:hypothetical protein